MEANKAYNRSEAETRISRLAKSQKVYLYMPMVIQILLLKQDSIILLKEQLQIAAMRLLLILQMAHLVLILQYQKDKQLLVSSYFLMITSH